MRCVKLNDQVQRVPDYQASILVVDGWSYCSKEEWKKVRSPIEKVKLVKVKKLTKKKSANTKTKSADKEILHDRKREKKLKKQELDSSEFLTKSDGA